MRWLLLESYYDGSHRQLIDGLLREGIVDDPVLWTLPGRKWKWRMRGAALEFARRMRDEAPGFDAVLVTSLTNAAELRGLMAREGLHQPVAVYFHENQLAYPVQHFDKRDHHFAWTNLHSALAADRLAFNSRFNLDSFLEGMDEVVRKMPDARPTGATAEIRERALVLPVPISEAPDDRAQRSGPCHILWNHRWEFDKGGELLRDALRELIASGEEFQFSLLGQNFQTRPAVFDEILSMLGERVRHQGFLEPRQKYWSALASADVVLSTAQHEFQGLAILEGCSVGAVPLVPDGLAYRERFPAEWRYADLEELGAKLLDRCRRIDHWRGIDPKPVARACTWSALAPRWRKFLGPFND